MEIKQLITFKIAVENLNFTQTAKMLSFAQSSVTAQIKSLEEEIGKPLFERLGKRLILTEAGHQFKSYAEKMIQLSEKAIQAANGEEISGVLTIGAQESQLTYRLPGILREFKEAFPSVKLVFQPAHSDDMVRKKLMDGLLDIAFIMDKKVSRGSLEVERLTKENLKLVVASAHPFHEAFSVETLKDETLLLTETGCSYRDMFKDALHSSGVYPLDKIEFASIEAIKQSVIAGLGVALLPEMAVRRELRNGQMKALPWNAPLSSLYTQIAWHKDKQVTPPIQAFIDLTRKAFKTNNTEVD